MTILLSFLLSILASAIGPLVYAGAKKIFPIILGIIVEHPFNSFVVGMLTVILILLVSQ